MPVVTLRNINPVGHVDLPLIFRQGEPIDQAGRGCLVPGEEFEVDAQIAGRAPSVTKDPDTGEDVVDPGEGLLAQVGNYELVDSKPKGGKA